MAPGIYIIAGTAFFIGAIVGIWISKIFSPIIHTSVLEEGRKRRLIAEEEFKEMCLIRMGEMEPDNQYEEYLQSCNIRKFARRCRQMFESYGSDLRGMRVYYQIMEGASQFKRVGDEVNPELEADVRYYDLDL